MRYDGWFLTFDDTQGIWGKAKAWTLWITGLWGEAKDISPWVAWLVEFIVGLIWEGIGESRI